jgi:hypothetical protein
LLVIDLRVGIVFLILFLPYLEEVLVVPVTAVLGKKVEVV